MKIIVVFLISALGLAETLPDKEIFEFYCGKGEMNYTYRFLNDFGGEFENKTLAQHKKKIAASLNSKCVERKKNKNYKNIIGPFRDFCRDRCQELKGQAQEDNKQTCFFDCYITFYGSIMFINGVKQERKRLNKK